MKKFTDSFFILVFVIAVSIFPFNSAPAEVGGYVGVFGGYTMSPDATLRYYNYNYRYNSGYGYAYDGRDYDVDIQETWVFGFKVGYTPPPLKFLSFEFEYSYLNPDVDRSVLYYVNYTPITIEGDATFSNFMFNAIVKYPEGKIHPYIGGGLGFSYVDVSVSTTPTARSASHDETVFAWQILVGIDFELTNNLSVDIGYRYFATEDAFDDDNDYYHEHDYQYYSSQLNYKTSIVTFGFKYRF